MSSLYETTPKANRDGLSAIKTFGKPSKLPDSVGITNFNFWMACLGYWKVTTNFILDRWRIQIQRPVQHCCSSSSSLRSFPICLLNKLFLLLLTLVTCIFTIWSWMASRIIIANMSVSYNIGEGYEFPGRTGPDIQICRTGPTRLYWILIYFQNLVMDGLKNHHSKYECVI